MFEPVAPIELLCDLARRLWRARPKREREALAADIDMAHRAAIWPAFTALLVGMGTAIAAVGVPLTAPSGKSNAWADAPLLLVLAVSVLCFGLALYVIAAFFFRLPLPLTQHEKALMARRVAEERESRLVVATVIGGKTSNVAPSLPAGAIPIEDSPRDVQKGREARAFNTQSEEWLDQKLAAGKKHLRQARLPSYARERTLAGDPTEFNARQWARAVHVKLGKVAPAWCEDFDAGQDLPEEQSAHPYGASATREQLIAFLAARVQVLSQLGMAVKLPNTRRALIDPGPE